MTATAAVLAASVAAAPCPSCQNTGTSLGTGFEVIADPSPGDIAICYGCGAINIVTDQFTLRSFAGTDSDCYDPWDLARAVEVGLEIANAYLRRN